MSRLLVIGCLFLLFACEERPKKKVIACNEAPKAMGAYSPAVESGRWLYLSGQIGLRQDGSLDSSNFQSECRQALVNIEAILKCSGRSLDNVCKSTVYLTSLQNYKALNEVYFSFFKKDVPAREVVEVKALPKQAHVEISVVAD
jgi:2-iminobutanoate/2-iminopropanoate deaminase